MHPETPTLFLVFVFWVHVSLSYRFRDCTWKERGLGNARLLRNAEGRVRFLMRQEKTMKIVANFVVADQPPYCELKCHQGSDKSWVWSAQDWSEDEVANEQFLLRFKDASLAEEFKVAFDEAKMGLGVPRFFFCCGI